MATFDGPQGDGYIPVVFITEMHLSAQKKNMSGITYPK